LPFTRRKKQLIDHLRSASGITDERVLSAIESIPRERFVLQGSELEAWEDIALPIAEGQTISQPTVVATMTQALELSDRDKVLEIGTGSGYQACILAKLCRRVYTIERHRPLHLSSERLFKELGLRNITTLCADGMKGWPPIHNIYQHPFDKIIVTCAARSEPPPALLDQLRVGGILIIPVGPPGEQMLKRYKRETVETYSSHNIMEVRFVPLLPDVASAKDVRREGAL
jgi:protein-L-isoaspartate(D-aspartate) O-methyltransferase